MKRFGLIGFPVEHSMSPALFKAAYGGLYPYELINCPDFEEAWEIFIDGYDAVNVTMPFKALAARRADFCSEAVKATGAANILVKEADGVHAYNSDYMAVRSILAGITFESIAIIGTGGAGRAASFAAESIGKAPLMYHHDGISGGVKADVIIYTLPKAVPGMNELDCRVLIEANYKDPCLEGENCGRKYVSGMEWLKLQAVCGYALMTGETPDRDAVCAVEGKTK